YVSEPVEAHIVVNPGLFGADGMIVGSTYFDRNGNGVRDPGEPGIPRARLITDAGIEIVTDEDGLFSLKGVYPGVHAVKLVLPESVKGAGAEDARGAGESSASRIRASGASGAEASGASRGGKTIRVPVSGIAT